VRELLVIGVHLVHLRLTRPDRAPEEAEPDLILDALWALAPPDAGIEHLRVRAGPEGIDLTLFLRHGIPDPDLYACTLIAALARMSPSLSGWHISTTAH
jgi:hypothetical protein